MFLLQVTLAGLSLWFATYLYRNSDWLRSNKPITIDLFSSGSLNGKIERFLNARIGHSTPVFVFLLLPVILGVLFCGLAFFYVAAFAFVEFLDSYKWWEQNLMIFGLFLFFYGVVFYLKNDKKD
jgi:hypothetical protein